MRVRLPLAATLAVALALGASACGVQVGAGSQASGTQLLVTQDFGSGPVEDLEHPAQGGSDTVMRLLMRNAKVTTRFGGGFVQSIDGHAGTAGPPPRDWFYYVNGVEATKGAAATKVHDDDRVWWDRHDWSQTQDVPAVVGSFPEPFRHGTGGKRLPVRVECSDPGSAPCSTTSKRLAAYGIVPGEGTFGGSLAQDTLRILVGRWPVLRADRAAGRLEQGPQVSGVYAEPSPDGRTLKVLDPDGHVARTLGPGTGLVAATRIGKEEPVWIVTGTDDAGIAAAANALEEGVLGGHFALAVSGGQAVDVPAVALRG